MIDYILLLRASIFNAVKLGYSYMSYWGLVSMSKGETNKQEMQGLTEH